MVASNQGCPDPDKPPEDVTLNTEMIITTDTDTDEEDNLYNEYEPLPTQDIPEMYDNDENNSEEEEEEGAVATDQALHPVTRIEDTLVKEVWDTPYPKDVDIVMDTDKIDEVKQAMVNFTLPASSIPEWANHIPEEQWKQQLIDRLQKIQK